MFSFHLHIDVLKRGMCTSLTGIWNAYGTEWKTVIAYQKYGIWYLEANDRLKCAVCDWRRNSPIPFGQMAEHNNLSSKYIAINIDSLSYGHYITASYHAVATTCCDCDPIYP